MPEKINPEYKGLGVFPGPAKYKLVCHPLHPKAFILFSFEIPGVKAPFYSKVVVPKPGLRLVHALDRRFEEDDNHTLPEFRGLVSVDALIKTVGTRKSILTPESISSYACNLNKSAYRVVEDVLRANNRIRVNERQAIVPPLILSYEDRVYRLNKEHLIIVP
jgi:hypothetical protein